VSADDDAFREQVRTWLAEHLAGEWAHLRGVGGSGAGEHMREERLAWNRHLAEHGWTCLGWPEEYGGRGLSLTQQAIFHEEYARADGPELVNHLGEQLLGPTLIEFGTDEQKERFLPRIRTADELWCQGYSEPGAGSDLAAVSTRAVLDEAAGEWVVDGQKVWTSWAQNSDWIFVIARTEPGSSRHHGLSFLLMPLDQDGIEVRPIEQITGGKEFNEVFFSGARTPAEMIVGEPGDGWRVAMALLGFERGVSVLGQQVGFERELNDLIDLARENGALDDPVLRDRLAAQSAEFEVMRVNAVRSLTEATPGADNVAKLVWAGWHKRLGKLAMEVLGAGSLTCRPDVEPVEASFGQAQGPTYDLDRWQNLFLFSRADTLYGGSDEIQRNILAERVLGLPKEARG
jgi:alkylation response protein AidB-like acyl-CoA dehydrogenase